MDPQTPDTPNLAEQGRAPRWVKGLGVAGGVLLLLFVVLHLTGLAPQHHFGHPAGHAVSGAASDRR